MRTSTRDSRIYKVRIAPERTQDAIGLEVHVEGWGTGPFFTVRGFDGTTALLSTRYSRRIKYRVPFARCYFTQRSGSIYQRSKP